MKRPIRFLVILITFSIIGTAYADRSDCSSGQTPSAFRCNGHVTYGIPGTEDQLLAYRTRGEYWGKERAVVVTYTPATARKQNYTFQSKLDTIRQQLLIMRNKVREKAPHWKKQEAIRERYVRLCERLHVSSDFYTIGFEQTEDGLSMSFRKDVYRISKKQAMFGKNIIITDNTDWTTREIVEANTRLAYAGF